MTYAAQVAIAADRYTPCVRTITFRGLDLTGVAMRMQVRQNGDTPGAPMVDLQNVDSAQAEGIKLVSVVVVDAYPTSVVQIRINETTIKDAAKFPFVGELGDASPFVYDLIGTLGGDKRVLMAGTFTVAAGVTGADNAPLNRPFGYAGRSDASGMRTGAILTFGETRIDVRLDGADLLAPLAQQAVDAAASAEADSESAALAAGAALASSRYFTTRAAGEAASATNQFFSTDDGAGNLIYYKRNLVASTEIGRALTPAWLAASNGAERVGFEGRTLSAKLGEMVSVRDGRFAGGAKGNGVADDTAAFQAAHDALPNGGIINVPPGVYFVSCVKITNRKITYLLAPGAVLKRFGTPALATRGMFMLANLLFANFSIRGGEIDLNGEGPMGIGVAGRIPNRMGSRNISSFPTVFGITGPENAAIYALRSTFISVDNVEIYNTGESGFVFRNCGDVTVDRLNASNIANYAVEFSIVTPANDGGTIAMPFRGRYRVTNSKFRDIDDYCLGTGNAVAIGGGGSGNEGNISDIIVDNCTFERCQRDVHFEFTAGTWSNLFAVTRIRSTSARQGSIGFVNARNGIITDVVIIDPGFGPTGALLAQILGGGTASSWPSIYGITLSGDIDNVRPTNFQITDKRNSKLYVGADGAIDAGSKVFTSPSANFTANDVGTFIGIAGAGSSAGASPAPHIAQILTRTNATTVTLDLAAATTVAGAKYAYGGACREPLRLRGPASVEVSNGAILAGTHSGLPNEPVSSAISIDGISGRARFGNLRLMAPATQGTAQAGVRIVSQPLGKIEFEPKSIRISGYAAPYVGVETYKAAIENPTTVTRGNVGLGQSASASANAGTYGPAFTKLPRGNHFTAMIYGSIEFDSLNAGGVAGETATLLITATRYDGTGPNTVTINVAAPSMVTLTPVQLSALNEDGAWLTSLKFEIKSDKAGSTARARPTILAIEG